MTSHSSYSDPYDHLRELTLRGMILGALITVIFTASNVYLGLKVGLTFASSIPAAVISMAVLRFFSGANILENNMVQTQASAAGTLSSIIFVLPGLLMVGYWQGFPFWQTTAICVAGGFLGVVFTIPLRHVMVVKSDLPYPEGVAAAEILKAGDHNAADAQGQEDENTRGLREIIFGGLIAGVINFFTSGLRLVADSAGYFFKVGTAIFQIPLGFSPALLGAGYLIGIGSGLAILTGLLIAWGVLVPIYSALAPAAADASLADIARGVWSSKVRFVGVGTMTVAAIWTLLALARPMIEGLIQSHRRMKALKQGEKAHQDRCDQDLSAGVMLAVIGLSLVVLWITFSHFVAAAGLSTGIALTLVAVCTLMSFVIGFLVAAACGYMAGLVGSSSSPISGIGIISIVVMSVVLFFIGQAAGLMDTAAGQQFVTALALFGTAVVLAISCISNDNLQDLKTGYLVHATPWKQQVALMIGCVVGALVIAPVLQILYQAYGFTGALPHANMSPDQALNAPQATLMATIARGIFNHSLQWRYILTGMVIGVVLIVVDYVLRNRFKKSGLPVLAVGMGIYLPPAINMPIFVGAVLSYALNNMLQKKHQTNGMSTEAIETSKRRGTLFSAGLIVGESLIGVLLALVIAASVTSGGSQQPLSIRPDQWELPAQWLGLMIFVVLMVIFARRVLRATVSPRQ